MTNPFTYTKPINSFRDELDRFFQRYKVHFLVWSCFILNEVFAAGYASGEFGPPINYIAFYGLNIGLFYFNALVILPIVFQQRRHAFWRLPVLMILLICGYLIIAYALKNMLLSKQIADGLVTVNFDKTFVTGSLWRSSFYIGLSFGFYFLNAFVKAQYENSKLERNALKSELREQQTAVELSNAKNAFLQAQISPHFLNSALNFLHSHTRKLSPAVADLIHLLSKITRFAGSAEYTSIVVPLKEELQQVSSLIQLWRIIKDHRIYIRFEYNDAAMEVLTIPLLLLTLTENVFKHGDIYNPESPARISVKKYNDAFLIITENTIHEGRNDSGNHSGLVNIEHRLNYIYGESAMINYGPVSKNKFVVSVFIHLKSYQRPS
ncbi:histidine kinase [Pedobacter sp. GR22-6]|uniref:histidine kinase n=1 Tax=Pedobacter sp. GR22-6 TaxID=3127957 RepID=UPI00307EEFAC